MSTPRARRCLKVLNRLNIAVQVIAVFIIISIFSIVIGIVGVKANDKALKHLIKIEDVNFPSAEELAKIALSQSMVLTAERGLINNDMLESKLHQSQYDRIEVEKQIAQEAIKNYLTLPQASEEKQMWEQFLPLWETWLSHSQQVVQIAQEKDAFLGELGNVDAPQIKEIDTALINASLQSRESFLKAQDSLNTLIDINTQAAHNEGVVAKQEVTLSFRLMLGGMFLSILLALILGYYLLRTLRQRLVNPVKEMGETVHQAASGDLSVDIAVDSNDEIGQLAKALKNMILQIRGIISEVSEKSNYLSSSAGQLNANYQQSTVQANQTATTMGEIASAVSQVAASVQEISQVSVKTSDFANNGKEGVAIIGSQMQAITDSTTHASDVIHSLSQKAKEITQIVELISSISDQTNLLALNAAIEAARAGEQGRGFAVVAEEVRKLAEQSAQAAKRIKDLIISIQLESQKAEEAMSSGSQEVEAGNRVVNELKESFNAIIEAVHILSDQIQEAASATEETSAGVQEVAATVEEQTASMGDVASAAESLAILAEELSELVSKFKL